MRTLTLAEAQAERERLQAAGEAWHKAAAEAEEVYNRLEHLDELDEAIAIEQYGDGSIRHQYSGEPIPWIQQRLSEAWRVTYASTLRLQRAARELERCAGLTSRLSRLDHLARGYAALADEAWRVVDSYGPGRERESADWGRIDAIRDGIRRLRDLQEADLHAEIRHELRGLEEYRRDMTALGMGQYIAKKVDGDPAVQRVLRRLRETVFGKLSPSNELL